MARSRILIVDDEQIARENLEHVLRREGYETVSVSDGLAAIGELEKEEFDLVLTDIRMQPVDGLQVLDRARELYPNIEVIVITGYASVSTAVDAMSKGAYYYIPKPYKIDEVRVLVRQAIEKRGLRREVTELRQRVGDQGRTSLLIGSSADMETLRKMIDQVAISDSSVLILGETGTGKELVARTIHNMSLRVEKRFLAINCGAFSEELLANELFGHEREAFTGAKSIKRGLLEAAQGGTIFLDEIGDMPLSIQSKILRTLQNNEIRRLGGSETIRVNVRFIAATNNDLAELIRKNLFREDLYYRLNAAVLSIPALRDRRDDIPLLVGHFLAEHSLGGNAVPGRPGRKEVTSEVMARFLEYEWPGNVRELKNVVHYAAAMSSGERIGIEDLPVHFLDDARGAGAGNIREDMERSLILKILQTTKYNRSKTAELLNMSRKTLYSKMVKYGLNS